MLTTAQQDVLRRLVATYMDYALLPVQTQKVELWKALNRSAMIRPMVAMDQMPWNELGCDELKLQITDDPFWRGVELWLRQTLYKWRHCPVDMVLEPFIPLPYVLHQTGFGLTPDTERRGAVDTTAPAVHFHNQLTDEEDVAKITDNHITADRDAIALHEEEARAYLGDLAPALSVGSAIDLGIWDVLTGLIGPDNVLYELIDRPEFIHALMQRLTDATLCAIDDLNKLKLHAVNSPTCHCSYVYTDELLPAPGAGKVPGLSKNTWAYGLAQILTTVSPAMFEEFELPYITQMASHFGRIYYGCCDRLDDRLDIVARIPNVAKVSCSPWSDRAAFAKNIGPKLIMSVKPSPALLAFEAFDEEAVRKDLNEYCTLARAYGVNMEFLLKDISTVRGCPERLTRWATIAMQVVEAY